MPAPTLDERGLPPGYPYRPDWEVTPREVRARLDAGEEFALIDCRTPPEHAQARIEGATLLPLQQLPQRLPELEPLRDKPIVVHCGVGQRSLQFAHHLRQQGFTNVMSMAGGIQLWNADPMVRR